MKVDLGSGPHKQDGFLGVDRFQFGNVDIVCDLNDGITLPDSSVEVLYASHSLEHVKDLMHTMREVYRVCKHKSQVVIIAPYQDSKLNIANPYHLSIFNEHTPRFWTDYPYSVMSASDLQHPQVLDNQWGLSRSDHSNPGLDIRLLRAEFFYFPQYLTLTEDEKVRARNKYFDVCDQIMFHLIVWKPSDENELFDQNKEISNMDFYEPEYIKYRRLKDNELESEMKNSEMVNTMNSEMQFQDAFMKLNEKYFTVLTKYEQLLASNSSNAIKAARTEAKLEGLKKQLEDKAMESFNQEKKVSALFNNYEKLVSSVEATTQENEKLKFSVEPLKLENDIANSVIKGLQHEIGLLKERVNNQDSGEMNVSAINADTMDKIFLIQSFSSCFLNSSLIDINEEQRKTLGAVAAFFAQIGIPLVSEQSCVALSQNLNGVPYVELAYEGPAQFSHSVEIQSINIEESSIIGLEVVNNGQIDFNGEITVFGRGIQQVKFSSSTPINFNKNTLVRVFSNRSNSFVVYKISKSRFLNRIAPKAVIAFGQ